jgi:small-conductance mechanosensitive channel
VGVGFGLQKVTSNFISGLILLFEKSIKVGDLIELGPDAHGVVKQLSARYVLIEAPNGKDVLVPNEDLITHRVVNWTLTNNFAKVEILVSVSYHSDVELVQRLMLDAAKEHSRTLEDPAPACFLREFGDNGILVLLTFFVDDVIKGTMRPQSDVMASILDKFKANGVTISIPQHTVYVKKES